MDRRVFSTSSYRLEDRFAAWRSRDWPSLAPAMDCAPPEGAFGAEVETLVAAGTPIIFSDMSGFFFSRSAARLRSDELDHFGLLISRDISFHGEAAGRSFAGRSGELLIGDFARPIEQYSTDGNAISLALPRTVAESAIPWISTMHGRVIEAPRVGLFADFLLSVRSRASSIGASDEPALTRILLDLLRITFGATDTPSPEGDAMAGETRMWVVRRLVEAELDASDLGPEFLMRALRVSRSTLYRMFEPFGGVAEYIRTARLERAAALLVRPGPPARISEVARACGFADQASFSRTFRQFHGCTPTEWRANNALSLI